MTPQPIKFVVTHIRILRFPTKPRLRSIMILSLDATYRAECGSVNSVALYSLTRRLNDNRVPIDAWQASKNPALVLWMRSKSISSSSDRPRPGNNSQARFSV